MLGSGMLILGLFATFSFAQRALPAAPLAARLAQVLGAVAVIIFLWPTLKSLFTLGR